MTVKAGNESEEREVMEQIERAGQSLGGRAGAGHGKDSILLRRSSNGRPEMT